MITRKIAATILSAGFALMAIPALSVSGETYSGECGENLTWTIDEDGTITISGEGAMYDYAGNDYTYDPDDILKEIENHTVSPFAYYGGSKLVIEEGVTHICDNSFVGLLNSVSFPSSLISIGEGAFALSFLTELTLPEGLEEIGDYAFWSNMSLQTVQLPESVKKIGAWAFCQCGLEDIVIPASVQSIGNYAFGACFNMKSIAIRSKDCVIEDNNNGATISDNMADEFTAPAYSGTIYGYTNSTALAFASKYNYKFAALDAEQTTTVSTATTAASTTASTTAATTAAATTTTSAPSTGETGIALAFAGLLLAACTAFVCRNKD